MTIHLLSADHRFHNLDDVARLSQIDGLGQLLCNQVPHIRGVVVLKTCNRVAIHLDVPDGCEPAWLRARIRAVLAGEIPENCPWAANMCARTHESASSPSCRELDSACQQPQDCLHSTVLKTEFHHLWDKSAVHDIFATFAGLESMVVGEREISGQMRRALKFAVEEGTASADLIQVFEAAARATKRVHTLTDLASRGRSVVAVGLDLAAQHIDDFASARIVLMGTGAYAGATVTALKERGCKHVEAYSYSNRGKEFALARGIDWVESDHLVEALVDSDLIITCRGLGTPIVNEELIRAVLQKRDPNKPVRIVDLALAADVEQAVIRLPQVHYIGLQEIQKAVPQVQQEQVAQARAIVHEETDEFLRQLAGRRMDPVVLYLRNEVAHAVSDEMKRMKLGKATGSDASTSVPVEEVRRSLHHLAARLVHLPMIMARKAGEENREEEYKRAFRLVFGVDDFQ